MLTYKQPNKKTVWVSLPIIILLSFNHFTCSKAGGPPRVLPINDEKRLIFAPLGKAFSIKCPVDTKDGTGCFIDWFKGNRSLYLESHYRISKGVLKIKEVTIHDIGIYTCIATNGYGSTYVNITLLTDGLEKNTKQNNLNRSSGFWKLAQRDNREPPSIKTPSTQFFQGEIGSSISISCTANGNPVPYIIWMKDNVLLNNRNNEYKVTSNSILSTFVIRKLTEADAGIYRCIAKNSKDEDKMDFHLRVTERLFPPKIVSLKPSESRVLASHTTTFNCEVQSKSGVKVHIKWYKEVTDIEMQEFNATFLRLGSYFYRGINTQNEIRVLNGINGVYQSKLQIPKAKVQDSGIYICIAVNDKGYTFKNVSLTVFSADTNMAKSILTSATNTVFLVLIVFSAAVVLSAVVFTIFLYRKCRTIKKLNLVDTVTTEAQKLTSFKIPSEVSCTENLHDQNFSASIICNHCSSKFHKSRLLTTQSSTITSHNENCMCLFKNS